MPGIYYSISDTDFSFGGNDSLAFDNYSYSRLAPNRHPYNTIDNPDGSVVQLGAGNDATLINSSNITVYDAGGTNGTFITGGGNTFFGGNKKDSYLVNSDDNHIHSAGDRDFFVIYDHNHNDIDAGSGDDIVISFGDENDIKTGQGVDKIDVVGHDNTVNGGSGSDIITALYGGSSNDFVIVNNSLTSFDEANLLTGGDSRDSFRFNTDDVGHEVITDFRVGQDGLALAGIESANDIVQEVITGGVYGRGLLIHEEGNTHGGIFLQGVTKPITFGIIHDDVMPS